MSIEAPKTVWFWNYNRRTEQYEAIILTEGEKWSDRESEPTDEGYSFWNESYEYEDGVVYGKFQDGGRDCDGEISNTSSFECPYDQLFEHRNRAGKRQPNWSDRGTVVYDQYAQEAGY
jgi:hypothetical protein